MQREVRVCDCGDQRGEGQRGRHTGGHRPRPVQGAPLQPWPLQPLRFTESGRSATWGSVHAAAAVVPIMPSPSRVLKFLRSPFQQAT